MFSINQIFGAPLAGVTDKPFRRIVRLFAPMAPLVTEMISCHSIIGAHRNCLRNFDRYDDEGPIGAQIFGADANLMADAAKILADSGAKWIDINMGCPVPKVATRSGAGAYLMRDHILAGKIINAVAHAVEIPVSIKTRLGWDSDNVDWYKLVQIAADNGAKFVTLHGRTRAQLYSGNAVHPKIDSGLPIPVIANGDLKTDKDVQEMQNLGYAGAMVGRAMLGRPWILGQFVGTNAPMDVCAIVLKHLEYVLEYYGVRAGVPMFRKHAAWYSLGMANASEFRTRVNQISDANELKREICKFWGCI